MNSSSHCPNPAGSVLKSILCATILCSTFQKTFWYIGGFRFLLSDLLMLVFCLTYFFAIFWRGAHPDFAASRGFFLSYLPYLVSMLLSGFVNAFLFLDVDLFFKGIIIVGFHLSFCLLAIKVIAHGSKKEQMYYPLSFMAGALLSVIYSIAQYYFYLVRGVDLDVAVLGVIFSPSWHEGLAEYGSIYKISGLLADPNHFGLVIVISLAIAICVLMNRDFTARNKFTKPILAAIVLVLFLALVFTFSRTAFVALSVMFLILLILGRRIREFGVSRIIATTLLPMLLVFCSLLYIQKDALAEVISYKLDPDSASVVEHTSLYGESFSMWGGSAATMLFGVGPNNFSAVYEKQFSVAGWNPHSMWLLELVEGGLVGFICYLAILGYTFRSAYLLFSESGYYQYLGLAYTAAFAAMLAGGLFYEFFRWHYMVTFQALIIGMRESQKRNTYSGDGGNRFSSDLGVQTPSAESGESAF